uniref:Mixed-linked glucanase n=1 Tax=Ganoderma boninense TaxID=34458 RepID=A0A5K1JY83_9APHY|nr:Mixed-linked glucanase [Ganoderma boninense]
MFSTGALLSLACVVASVLGTTWKKSDSYVGSQFLSGFDHVAIADPTHGRVNYLDQATAVKKNITYAHGDTLILRADHTTTLSASGPGRDSFRLMNKKTYTNHVTMCVSESSACSVDMADWRLGVLVGMSGICLGAARCTAGGSRSMTGTSVGTNCDVAATVNAGCPVLDTSPKSFGESFNSNGGGFFAMERSSAGVKVWFWPQHASNIPSDVLNVGATSVNTASWGTPMADFPSTSCDMASHFGLHNIVINLTFCKCGDWAGQDSIYSQDGCSGSCVDHVNNNPCAFDWAYFDIAWLKIYQ